MERFPLDAAHHRVGQRLAGVSLELPFDSDDQMPRDLFKTILHP
jgi:hypothetical protein